MQMREFRFDIAKIGVHALEQIRPVIRIFQLMVEFGHVFIDRYILGSVFPAVHIVIAGYDEEPLPREFKDLEKFSE